MKLSRLMTVQQVMEYLGKSQTTVYGLLRSGELKGVKVGRDWRVKEEDLNDYVTAATEPSTVDKKE